jgi:hypothetical protein
MLAKPLNEEAKENQRIERIPTSKKKTHKKGNIKNIKNERAKKLKKDARLLGMEWNGGK